ncbi:ABC transporter ATP-binding protein [Anaerococcus sp. mt242]|uniref:ABC transporter ATP-binding protein n=1 Tax=Anaerococcus sp. mt242 TaxID=2661917 RepID=UPI0019332FBF|nr:ABC transporter ATP-binding protein [Anaerococcus sp. mt242]MBM0047089.1 ABC transporter ATP-binding protein [Anaerococcus sp. mt242]
MFKFEHVKYKDIIDIDNLNINLGEVTCIIGPSGSGKSTCLRLINKLISPTTGIISLNGENIANINSVEYRRKVPMLSQSPVSFPGNIRDNLLMGRKFQGKNEVSDSDLQNALDKVSLDEPLDKNIENLSGGEQQRVSIARLMLLDSDIFLLDEPSSALDDITEDFVIKSMVNMAKSQNKTIIYVTHSNSMAEKYSDRVIKIVDGRVNNG